MPALEGAKVTFVARKEPNKAQVIVRYRNEPITARSYVNVTPPISLLDDCVVMNGKRSRADYQQEQQLNTANGKREDHTTANVNNKGVRSLECKTQKETQVTCSEESLLCEQSQQEQEEQSPSFDKTTNTNNTTTIITNTISNKTLHAKTGTSHPIMREEVSGYAADIVVDLSSIPDKQLCRFDGPLVHMEGVAPTSNLKDLRNSRVLDSATNEYLRFKRVLGNERAAREACEREEERRYEENKKYERVIAQKEVHGVITAWSQLHRSGIITKVDKHTSHTNNDNNNNNSNTLAYTQHKLSYEQEEREQEQKQQQELEQELEQESSIEVTHVNSKNNERDNNICIIRNAFSFASALPTSSNMLGKCVTFTEVVYPIRPEDRYAEEIQLVGPRHFDATLPSVDEVRGRLASERKAEQVARQRRARGLIIMDMESNISNTSFASMQFLEYAASNNNNNKNNDDNNNSNNNNSDSDSRTKNESVLSDSGNECHYGVILRWSAGNGVVESETGNKYYIPTSAQFNTLIDCHDHHIRGAVVRFNVESANPHIAYDIEVLSTPESNSPHMLHAEATRVHERIKNEYQTQRLQHQNKCHNNNKNNDYNYNEEEQQNRTRADSATCTNCATNKVDETNNNKCKKSKENNELQECNVNNKFLHHRGVLRSWFAQERQGIITGEDDKHYVIRDAAEDVINYNAKHNLLRNGVEVIFDTNGEDGMLALNVKIVSQEHTTTLSNGTEDEKEEEEEQKKEEAGNVSSMTNDNRNTTVNTKLTEDVDGEAITPPTNINYWLGRMERVGLNVKYIRDRQNCALTLDEFVGTDDDIEDENEEDENEQNYHNNLNYDAHMYAREGYANKHVKMQMSQKSENAKLNVEKKKTVKTEDKFLDTLTLLKNDP